MNPSLSCPSYVDFLLQRVIRARSVRSRTSGSKSDFPYSQRHSFLATMSLKKPSANTYVYSFTKPPLRNSGNKESSLPLARTFRHFRAPASELHGTFSPFSRLHQSQPFCSKSENLFVTHAFSSPWIGLDVNAERGDIREEREVEEGVTRFFGVGRYDSIVSAQIPGGQSVQVQLELQSRQSIGHRNGSK